MVRHNLNLSVAQVITITSTADCVAIDPRMKLRLDDQIPVLPIRGVLLYEMRNYDNLASMLADGPSRHKVYFASHSHDDLPLSSSCPTFLSSSYEPPIMDYFNDLCFYYDICS
eukprot:315918-Pleurochrysis_carterae.AAC.1